MPTVGQVPAVRRAVKASQVRDPLMGPLTILHPPFLLGLIAGGAVIYWFTGASTQAVSTGAYRAVEFIKANISAVKRLPLLESVKRRFLWAGIFRSFRVG